MPRTQTDLAALARKLSQTPTKTKLILAVELLERNEQSAELVIEQALDDLRSMRLLKIRRVPLA